MHTHLCGLKNGKNITANQDGTLSTETLKMIGGILRFAPSLTAFGKPKKYEFKEKIAYF
jgi:glutamine synthetase